MEENIDDDDDGGGDDDDSDDGPSRLTVHIDSSSAVCQCVHEVCAYDGRWLDWQQLMNR